MSNWRPEGVTHRYDNRRPEVGETVAWNRRAWEVRHVADADLEPDEAEKIESYPPAWRDRNMPYRITLRRIHGPKHDRENDAQDVALRVRARAYAPFSVYPNGRVPLCSCCGHPWPCLVADQQEWAERELKRAEKAMNLLPGCCPACEEPVTSRQKSITFGGPNVQNPLAEGPTFHLRSKCRHAAAKYEEAWVADEPGRARSLLTLRCEGMVIVHHDGSAECFGANDSECPTVYARHRSHMACYVQSYGCGQGCPTTGHPGTRIAGRPADPRAVTRQEPPA